jgi:amino acid adenylation domain-containing protein
MDKRNIEDIIALTPVQEGMLYHYLRESRQDYYLEQLSLVVSGEIKVELFQRAWNTVVETNEMLRTAFRWEGTESPLQVVLKHGSYPVRCVEAPVGAESGRNIKFDLQEVPFRVSLSRLGKDKYRVTLTHHHILFDGWSTGIILREFFNTYNDLAAAKPPVKLVKTPFKEFVRWLQRQNRDGEKQVRFWREYLEDSETRAGISIKGESSGASRDQGKEIRTHHFRLTWAGGGPTDPLEDLIKDHKLTTAALLYGAWGLLLQRYSNSDDVIFGTTVSGRSAKIKGIEDMVGLFINTLPLRVRSNPGETALGMLQQLKDALETREAYESTPLVKINEYCRWDGNQELFDTIVVIENYPLDLQQFREMGQGGLLTVDSYSLQETTHYDLTAVIKLSSGRGIDIDLLYREQVFARERIRGLASHFTSIFRGVLENPRQEISGIEMLSATEKHLLLEDFNNTDTAYARDEAVHQWFTRQAEKTPDQVTLSGALRADKNAYGENHLSYNALNKESAGLAHLLIEKGVGPDTIVAIMLERSLEMIIGIYGILKAGGAYMPIDPDYPGERMRYLLKDSGTKMLVTTSTLVKEGEKLRRWEGEKNLEIVYLDSLNPLSSLTLINLDHPNFPLSPATGHWQPATSLAYLIYTSGSTGRPKGVMVSHNSVVNLLLALQQRYPMAKDDTYLCKTSVMFDVSVTELFGWILGGGRLALLKKNAEGDPEQLMAAIQRYRITHINFVPSMFNVLVEGLNTRTQGQLSGLKVIFLAGEALLAGLVNRFRSFSTGIRLENLYGPTEGTVYASAFSLAHWQGWGRIPIGVPLPNVRLYNLDRHNRLQPVGVPGELCIGGIGVARGYLNKPELTHEKFINYNIQITNKEVPFGKIFNVCGEKTLTLNTNIIYKTGDLARWLADSNIEFLGRLDHQVKIRGFRIELGEIENRLSGHPQVKEAAVIIKSIDRGDHLLCAYVVPHSRAALDIPGLKAYLQERLPDYMVPARFVLLAAMPLTPTRKLDRQALPDPGFLSLPGYIAPRDALERKLASIWSQVLGTAAENIGIHANFFQLGGHSLKAVRLAALIHKELGIKLELSQFLSLPTIRQLALRIRSLSADGYDPIEPAEDKEYYELTPFQKRFFVFHRLKPRDISYNMWEIMLVEGQLVKEKFQAVFQRLSHRQESLRTSFHLLKGEPVQRVHRAPALRVEYDDLETADKESKERQKEKLIANFIRPFDLGQPPPVRLGFIKVEPGRHFLMFAVHHIVSDGVSVGIFITEFLKLYNEEEITPLRIRYRDYIEWRKRQAKKKGAGRKPPSSPVETQIREEEKVLNLPLDYPRPPELSEEGKEVKFILPPGQDRALTALSWQEDVTLYIVLLAAFEIFLAKVSHQDRIVLGSPFAGRLHYDLEGIIGLFINPLVLYGFPSSDRRFTEFLAETKEISFQAFKKQDMQYDELVEKMVSAAASGRNPLYDVMFVLQNMEVPAIRIPGLEVTREVSEQRSSKFDLTLYCEEKDHLVFKLEYSTVLFKPETSERFIRYFKRVISQILENPWQRIGDMELMSPEEKQQVLVDFNDTTVSYPFGKTIRQFLAEQVEKTPDRVALSGTLRADKNAYLENHLSYNTLNEESAALTHLLIEKGVGSDTIVAIMLERSLEMIIGIFGILKAGGAYMPIDPEYPGERLQYILAESSVKLLVTTVNIADEGEKVGRWEGEKNLEIVNLDSLNPLSSLTLINLDHPNFPLSPAIGHWQPATSLAYIIYTSGSTGNPKGVMVTHRSVANLVLALQDLYPFGEDDTYLLKTPVVFDVSVAELFGWVLGGGRLALLKKNEEKDPNKIIKAIQRHRVTHINFVPSMFNVFVEGLDSRSRGKLSTLKYIFLAGEALLPGLVDRFKRLSTEIPLENLYGPTEGTVYSSRFSLSAWRGRGTIPIGAPVANVRLYNLDRSNGVQPLGVPGELCIGGTGLARGYLNNPELTAEKFCLRRPGGRFLKKLPPWTPRKNFSNNKVPGKEIYKKLFQGVQGGGFLEKSPPGRRRLYKTGDLVRWLPDGNLEFLGRIDHQVKIRGFRIELGEIENRLLHHPHIKEAVVTVRDAGQGDNYLCAYIVPHSLETFRENGVRDYLTNKLPDYMVPSHFVLLERMPLNSSGKVDRKSLPEPGIIGSSHYVPPGNETEEILVGMWSELLGLDQDKIGIHDHFFQLGGHSLKAARLIGQIYKTFSIEISIGELFKGPTIKGISKHIHRAGSIRGRYCPVQPVEAREYYRLSSAQKRMYLLQQADLQSIGYHIPVVLSLEGNLEKEKLAAVFMRLTRRHESFRTSFVMAGGEPVQRIHDQVEFNIEDLLASEVTERKNYKLQNTNYRQNTKYKLQITNKQESSHGGQDTGSQEPGAKSYISFFNRPFDLSQAPLLRVGLVKLAESKHRLAVDMHHIISDGASMRVFIHELLAFYKDEELLLGELQYRYKDFSQWQYRQSETVPEMIKGQEEYWLRQLAGELPVLELPVDFVRPVVQSRQGHTLDFELGSRETTALKLLASAGGTTLYMVLLAITNIFLAKVSGQEEIIIGTPAAGRNRVEWQHVIGMFVNTLALRNFPARDKTFRQFLAESGKNTARALENQDYPFEDLVERLGITRDTSRNPLFDTMLVLQNNEIPEIELDGLNLKPCKYETGIAKFDLTFNGHEAGDGMSFTVEYCTRLFKQDTIRCFIDYFKRVINEVIRNREVRIGAIEILAAEQKRKLLVEFNDTAVEYPRDKTIQQIFVEQAAQAPDRVALSGTLREDLNAAAGVQLSYRALNERSGQVAGLLQQKGGEAGSLVAIMLKRSVEMVVGLLGILKADAAYMPIDPDYPPDRIWYLLKDSGTKMLVTAGTLVKEGEKLRRWEGETIRLEEILDVPNSNTHPLTISPSHPLTFLPSHLQRSASLAYIIYTSGSTGNPKGVMVEHRSVIRLVQNTDYIDLNSGTRILQTGALVFDAATFEVWGSLLNGGSLVLVSKDVILDHRKLGPALTRHQVNTLWLSAPLFNQLIEQDGELFSGLTYLLVGGDVLSPRHINRARSKSNKLKIINGYGPTENTTFSTCLRVNRDFESSIPIGKPIANSTAYILDKAGNCQPIGIWGELWVGGAGLARGYLNNPELTAEKFERENHNEKSKGFCGGSRGAVFLKSAPLAAGGKLYRTGDLGRWLPDGNIEFLGRIDNQVKIRGFRVEPVEIEARSMRHEKIEEAVVVVGGQAENKYLSLYFVGISPDLGPQLKDYLSRELPGYMIPSYFIQLEVIPLTINKKVDRRALLSMEKERAITSGTSKPARNGLEERLVKIWTDVLNLERVGIDDNFFNYGGHSLKVLKLLNAIEKELGVQIDFQEIYTHPTIALQAERVAGKEKIRSGEIRIQSRRLYYETSYSQKRLWVLYKMDPANPAFNLGGTTVLEEAVDETVIDRVIEALVWRHESLRTYFREIDGEPVQVIENLCRVRLHSVDLSHLQGAEQEAAAQNYRLEEQVTPFTLEQAPLVRIKLLKWHNRHYELLFNLHHIITDGWSMEVLEREFRLLYEVFKRGEDNLLPPLKLQYKDYAAWQNHLLADEQAMQKARRFWSHQLDGEIPRLELPYDYPNSQKREIKGSAAYQVVVPEAVTRRLRLMAEARKASLFMVMLAAFNVLLWRITGQQDLVFAVPAAARQHKDLENIIGFFVNTLIIRNRIQPDQPFSQSLQEVQANTLPVLEYQSFPLELLCREMKIKYPEIPLFFNMSSFGEIDKVHLEDTKSFHLPQVQNAKFDIVCYLREYQNGIVINPHYAASLFKPLTIERIMQKYVQILERITRAPGQSLRTLAESGKRQVAAIAAMAGP